MNPAVRRQILRYAIGLLIGSGLLLWYAYREWHGKQEASESPEAISLEQLIARGAEGNPHLLLRDFVPCANYTAVPTKSGDGWDAVYVPLIPGKMPAPNEPLPRSADKVDVLIVSQSIKEPRHLSLLRSPTGIRGLVVNAIDPLSFKHRDALQEHYPGIDLSQCVIVHEGRTPADDFALYMAAWIGSFLLVGGLLLLGLAALMSRRRQQAEPAPPSTLPRPL